MSIARGVAEERYELLRDWHIPEFKIVQQQSN